MTPLGQSGGGPVSLNHWPDHLPLQTLERMCLALVNRTVEGQIAVQYKVCVFSRATMFVTRWMRLCPSDGLARCLAKSKKSYAAACLQCLRDVDLTGGQSLLMLQTLLAGVSYPICSSAVHSNTFKFSRPIWFSCSVIRLDPGFLLLVALVPWWRWAITSPVELLQTLMKGLRFATVSFGATILIRR